MELPGNGISRHACVWLSWLFKLIWGDINKLAVKLFPGSYTIGREGSKLNTRLYVIPLLSDNAWDMTRTSTFCCFDSPLTCKQKLTISSEVDFLRIFVITVGKETKKQRRLTVRYLAYRIYKQCAYMGSLKFVQYLMENLGVDLLISVHSECPSAVVFKILWQQILKLKRKYLSVSFFESFSYGVLEFLCSYLSSCLGYFQLWFPQPFSL